MFTERVPYNWIMTFAKRRKNRENSRRIKSAEKNDKTLNKNVEKSANRQ